jgi:hypothetical protein
LLITETKAHPGTRRLAEITYRLDIELGGGRSRILEAEIKVANTADNPTVSIDATPYTPAEGFLR